MTDAVGESPGASDFTREFVVSKCDYFVDVQLWPYRNDMDPRRWLANFEEEEMGHAVALLNSFLYFSEQLVDELFVAAFQGISRMVAPATDPFLRLQTIWRSFVDSLILTYVTGESPAVTDSGPAFARKARQLLDVSESQIMAPEQALKELATRAPRPVVFVDDFVGTGRQFSTTWHRQVFAGGNVTLSFDTVASTRRGITFFYCPLVCTEAGLRTLRQKVPRVTVIPAHVLSERYSALHPSSVLWPGSLRPSASNFLYRASLRAGIPESKWKGFGEHGLALAFAHCVPDATMPIFYWDRNGWNPLIQRR